jgi:hypothetical protein
LHGCEEEIKKIKRNRWLPCRVEATGQRKKNLRAQQMLTGWNKKVARTDAAERQQADKKKSNLRAQQSGSDRSKRKKMLRALQSGLDRTKEKDSAWHAALKNKKNTARLKKLQLTDLRGQVCADRTALTGQRPVQPVHNAGSTGFDQDDPGKIWLKAAELRFSSEVQLATPAELESSAGQASWAKKKS